MLYKWICFLLLIHLIQLKQVKKYKVWILWSRVQIRKWVSNGTKQSAINRRHKVGWVWILYTRTSFKAIRGKSGWQKLRFHSRISGCLYHTGLKNPGKGMGCESPILHYIALQHPLQSLVLGMADFQVCVKTEPLSEGLPGETVSVGHVEKWNSVFGNMGSLQILKPKSKLPSIQEEVLPGLIHCWVLLPSS